MTCFGTSIKRENAIKYWQAMMKCTLQVRVWQDDFSLISNSAQSCRFYTHSENPPYLCDPVLEWVWLLVVQFWFLLLYLFFNGYL